MAAVIIGRLPMDYNDFGAYSPTKEDLELLDEEISKRLPEGISWCGYELLAEMEPGESIEDTRSRFEVDIEDIIEKAYEAVLDAQG